MASTYTFTGYGSIGTPTNWYPTGVPGPGDTAIIPSGTATGFDISFSDNTIEIGATSGTATLISVGDTAVSTTTPTVDAASLIESAVAGVVAAESSEIVAEGIFVNAGTIAANGPAGSSFTIAVAGAVINAAYQTGSFVNTGAIYAGAGNSMTISVGIGSALSNGGSITGSGLTLTGGSYLSNAGTITAAAAGSAVYGTTSPNTVANFGAIAGGNGSTGNAIGRPGYMGGAAIVLQSGGTITNGSGGMIAGGAGGRGATMGSGGMGGAAIALQSGGAITNGSGGMIAGGAGGNGGPLGGIKGLPGGPGGAGGAAVVLYAADIVTNSGGTIAGGAGGAGGGGNVGASPGGAGGTGVVLHAADIVTNSAGTIAGGAGGDGGNSNNVGAGGGAGGTGVMAYAGGTVTNSGGTIAGGAGARGGGGFSLFGGAGGAGGAGIGLQSGGAVTNSGGAITGGAGGAGGGGGSNALGRSSVGGYGGAGIALSDGGTVTNNGGTITGGGGGAGVLGGIAGTGGAGGAGIALSGGGTVINNGGTIAGGGGGAGSPGEGAAVGGAGGAGGAGVVVSGGGTIINAGTILGSSGGLGGQGGGNNYGPDGAAGTGIMLSAGGIVDNGSAGYMTALIAGATGIAAYNSAATVTNYGTISGTGIATRAGAYDNGVYLGAGGNITNAAGATISGGQFGIDLEGSAAAVVNSGIVLGAVDGVYAASGAASVSNSGTIEATTGIAIAFVGTAGNTLTDSGTIISGSGGTAVAFAGSSDRLILDPSYVIQGIVNGDGGTLELTGGSGTLTGLGTKFVDFATVQIDNGSSWTISDPPGGAPPNFIDNGTIVVPAGATLDFGSISSSNNASGKIVIGSGATVSVTGSVAPAQSIAFALATGTLALGDASQFAGTIANFVPGDTLALPGIAATSGTIGANNVLTIQESGGGTIALKLSGQSYAGDTVSVGGTSGGGLTVVPVYPVTTSATLGVRENSGPTTIGIMAPTDHNFPAADLTVTVTALPTDGTIRLANGITAVTQGEPLTVAQLVGLEFAPAANAFEQSSTFSYRVTDPASHASNGSATLEIGPSAPSAPSLGGGAGVSGSIQETNLATPVFTGTALPFDTVRLYNGTTLIGTGQANAQGVWNISSGSLKTGNYTITATATDALGLISAPSQASAIIVTSASTSSFSLGNSNTILQVGNGSDSISAGNGADVVIAGNGNDTVSAGNGSDNITLGGGNNIVLLGNGNDTLAVGNGDNLITLGQGKNTVTLGSGSNLLIAGNSVNTITATGSAGSTDIIAAGNGNNVLNLGAGTYDIAVGSGANTIDMGDGRYNIIAGSGADEFVYSSAQALLDLIYANNDQLVFEETGFNFGSLSGIATTTPHPMTGTGAALFSPDSNGTFASAANRFAYNASTGDLYYDAAGNSPGSAVTLVADLTNKPHLTGADLFFIS